jgi:hypothetical protein
MSQQKPPFNPDQDSDADADAERKTVQHDFVDSLAAGAPPAAAAAPPPAAAPRQFAKTMMQFSAAPWRLLDKKHFVLCRDAALIHTQYADKILDLTEHAKKTGEPIIRYMEYVFPDMGYEKVTDQFMLGDNILVAPVIKKGARSKDIHIPAGKWKSETGEVVTGPCKITVQAPLDRLPRYEKVEI